VSYTIIIPARYASSRLPGKPLALVAGKPMIERVWLQAQKAGASDLVVATDHAGVQMACERFGAHVCMTREDHESGTDRLAEVVDQLELGDDAIVVNVQGDEPLIPPEVIEQVALNLANNPSAGIATLCERITDHDTLLDPNAVKVVFDKSGYGALFQSLNHSLQPRYGNDSRRSGARGLVSASGYIRLSRAHFESLYNVAHGQS
jgi:3-deoxy-manno-octulosonate cytidylyltransferase (CMP-KDO synthetase)